MSSLINKKIAKFYVQYDAPYDEDVTKYFDVHHCFKFKEIKQHLWPDMDDDCTTLDDFQHCKYEDFVEYYNKLRPIYQYTNQVLPRVTESVVRDLKVDWLGNNIHLWLKDLQKETEHTEMTNLEHVLLLTAMLEYALGSIYSTRAEGRVPPHLLRDLLNTLELKAVLGIDAILFLKVLLGTPKSINLRNIVWHGFPTPQEVPAYYTSVLLLTLHTLGFILTKQHFQIQLRPQILDFAPHLEIIEKSLNCENPDLLSGAEELLENCNWLSSGHKLIWRQLLHYFHTANYMKFVVVILPQIELLLRLHYGHANHYDISAKLDEYYITMDTVFEGQVPVPDNATSRPNELLRFQAFPTQGTFKLIYDLFIAPNGPRLRDKIGHGEASLQAIDNAQLSQILLQLSLNLLNEKYHNSLENYESKYHLNCLTREALNQAALQLREFADIHLREVNVLFPSNNNLERKVHIFNRPRREPELMLLIMKISQLVAQTALNYGSSLRVRLDLLAQRELHSKRRRTLERMQSITPALYETLVLIWRNVENTFSNLQDNEQTALNDPKLLRFLKRTLTISENFVKYSHQESNEWIKVLELCKKFKDIQDKLTV